MYSLGSSLSSFDGIVRVKDVSYLIEDVCPEVKVGYSEKMLSRCEEKDCVRISALGYNGQFIKFIGNISDMYINGYSWFDGIMKAIYFIHDIGGTYIVSGLDKNINLKSIIDSIK